MTTYANDPYSFGKNFERCCEESCDRLSYWRQKDDPVVDQLTEQMENLSQRIEKILGTEKELFEQYCRLSCKLLDMDMLLTYQQGFQDSVYLLRWMGMLPDNA